MSEQIRIFGNKRNAIRRARSTQPPTSDSEPLDDRPRSVYEIVTRRMLEELRADLDEIKGRVNALLWLTAGAVLLDLVMRLVK